MVIWSVGQRELACVQRQHGGEPIKENHQHSWHDSSVFLLTSIVVIFSHMLSSYNNPRVWLWLIIFIIQMSKSRHRYHIANKWRRQLCLKLRITERHFQSLLKYLLFLLNPHSIISVVCYFLVGHKSPTNPQASISLRLSSPQMGSLSFKSSEGLFLWVQMVMARDHRKQKPNIVLYLKSICWIRSWPTL